MRKIAFCFFSIFLAFSVFTVWAQDQTIPTEKPAIGMTPPTDMTGWTVMPGAAYQFSNNGVLLFITTKEKMLTSKTATWEHTEEKSKYATEVAKHLKAKLLKIDQIQRVDFNYRMIVIRKFLLDDWQEALPEIIKVLATLEKME